MTAIKFEVDKHYRTRDGHKATILLIRPHYMVGEIEGIDTPVIWLPGGGITLEPYANELDLVAEWREPARLWVVLVRHRATGAVRVFEQKDLSVSWHELYEVLGTFELVEGEGLKS